MESTSDHASIAGDVPRRGRVGVLGGSFNPVHRGHLHLALLAREQAGLNHVIFVPAAHPPHKPSDALAPVNHRLAMLQLALMSEPDTSICTLELQDDGPRYTVETLRRLRRVLPDAKLHFILGFDSLRDLPTWREYEALLTEFALIAVDRPGLDANEIDPDIASRCRLVRGNPLGISASVVRGRAERGVSSRHLVPASVGDYMDQHRLYRKDAS